MTLARFLPVLLGFSVLAGEQDRRSQERAPFSTSFNVAKREYVVGEPVLMDLAIVNRSTSALRLCVPSLEVGGWSFSIVRDSLVPSLVKQGANGPISPVDVPAEGVHRIQVILNEAVPLKTPGDYVIQCEVPAGWCEAPSRGAAPREREEKLSGTVQFLLRQPSNADLDAVARGLAEGLKSKDVKTRELACDLLGVMEPDVAAKYLAEALKDKDASVRCRTVCALARHPSKDAVARLITALHDSSSDVREAAAHSFRRVKSEEAVPALSGAVHDSAHPVRQAALLALFEIKGKESRPWLEEGLEDRSPQVKETAKWLIERLK